MSKDHPITTQLPKLRVYALHLSAGHRADADDLVQDTVEHALKLWAAYEASLRDLGGWLRLVMYQRFCSRWHSPRGRMSRGEIEMPDEHPMRAGDLRADVKVLETRQHLGMLLGQVPEAQREAVERIYLHGETDIEAAAELDCSRATVRTRVHRALSSMRSVDGAGVDPAGSESTEVEQADADGVDGIVRHGHERAFCVG